ncbi:hypothetical protein G3A_03920 [Bacillus sp. 17376]|uniref:Threonine dehydratase n=1 Tax=Mesobacillus boroniphilus JCM 21738 TaxID=1294265 RepID=W4RPV8_9BACI|nr:hypothetical protein [Mesobacillus boroniphilus]ESU33953.1 hypothetical protein G3A_03920 [Bacillus sp. 17376]GAE45654.1 threonine dehydratase [Mesobacillus boroniphilus JCM 21738]
MEYLLKCRGNAFPCEVTIDEDNGRYMIKKDDSSGEVFNSSTEVVHWILDNWEIDDFYDQSQFEEMLSELRDIHLV